MGPCQDFISFYEVRPASFAILLRHRRHYKDHGVNNEEMETNKVNSSFPFSGKMNSFIGSLFRPNTSSTIINLSFTLSFQLGSLNSQIQNRLRHFRRGGNLNYFSIGR
jgi:hypothetical protein